MALEHSVFRSLCKHPNPTPRKRSGNGRQSLSRQPRKVVWLRVLSRADLRFACKQMQPAFYKRGGLLGQRRQVLSVPRSYPGIIRTIQPL